MIDTSFIYFVSNKEHGVTYPRVFQAVLYGTACARTMCPGVANILLPDSRPRKPAPHYADGLEKGLKHLPLAATMSSTPQGASSALAASEDLSVT